MGYQQAVEKAWGTLSGLNHEGQGISVTLLSDSYTVSLKNKTVMSDSCNVPAKEHVAILLLHYLARKAEAKAIPPLTGEWSDFKELPGGEGYYPAFKKRTIDRIVKKYGADPESIRNALKIMPGERSDRGDVGIVIRPFKEAAILITLSKADDEFGPDANILFDKNITGMFCTEDIVVLTEMVVHLI